jgi:hypothetical protein
MGQLVKAIVEWKFRFYGFGVEEWVVLLLLA